MMKEFIIDIDVGVVNYAPIIMADMLVFVFLLIRPGFPLAVLMLSAFFSLEALVCGFLPIEECFGGDILLPMGDMPLWDLLAGLILPFCMGETSSY